MSKLKILFKFILIIIIYIVLYFVFNFLFKEFGLQNIFETIKNTLMTLLLGACVIHLICNLIFGLIACSWTTRVLKDYDASLSNLRENYKAAQAFAKWKVSSDIVFVMYHGYIVPIPKKWIDDFGPLTIHHTRTVHRTVHGNTRYRERTSSYYTYHYWIKAYGKKFKVKLYNENSKDKLSFAIQDM